MADSTVSGSQVEQDRILLELFNKLAQIILQSRFSFSETRTPSKSSWQQFNLETEEAERIVADLEPWKRGSRQSLHVQLFMQAPTARQPGDMYDRPQPTQRLLMEHWELLIDRSSLSGTQRPSNAVVYQRFVQLVRAVYTCLRQLPLPSLIRAVRKAGRENPPMTFVYSLSPSAPSTSWGDERPSVLRFKPIPTSVGNMCCNVAYVSDLSRYKVMAEPQMSEFQIISDYLPGSTPGSLATPVAATPINMAAHHLRVDLPSSAPSSAPIGIPFQGPVPHQGSLGRQHSFTPDVDSHSFKLVPSSFPSNFGASTPPFASSVPPDSNPLPLNVMAFQSMDPPFALDDRDSRDIFAQPMPTTNDIVHVTLPRPSAITVSAAPPQSPSMAMRMATRRETSVPLQHQILKVHAGLGDYQDNNPYPHSMDPLFDNDDALPFALDSAELDPDSALGSFVKQCQHAPPLKMFASGATAAARSVMEAASELEIYKRFKHDFLDDGLLDDVDVEGSEDFINSALHGSSVGTRA